MNETLLFGPCNKLRVKIIAITLFEDTVSQLSKQEVEVRRVNHKVCVAGIEGIKARKIGWTREMCIREIDIEL